MAELVSIKRNVDVSPGQAAPAVFHCSQGDVGSKIILGLLSNGTAYAIPSGVTVTIEGSESNGSIFTPISATASGSDITFYLTGEMTAVAGPAICQAVLKSGSNILGTANFTLEVESSPMGADAPPVFTDAGWTWMLNKLTTEFVPALGDNIIDAIESKLDKNQGTANAGKYLKVGADGNVETADLDVTTDKTLSIADKAADAKAVGNELDDLKADLSDVMQTSEIHFTGWVAGNAYKESTNKIAFNNADVRSRLVQTSINPSIKSIVAKTGYSFSWYACTRTGNDYYAVAGDGGWSEHADVSEYTKDYLLIIAVKKDSGTTISPSEAFENIVWHYELMDKVNSTGLYLKKFAYGETPTAPYNDFNTFPVNETVCIFANTVSNNNPNPTKTNIVKTIATASNGTIKLQIAYTVQIVRSEAFAYVRIFDGSNWRAWQPIYTSDTYIKHWDKFPYGETPTAPYDDFNTFPVNESIVIFANTVSNNNPAPTTLLRVTTSASGSAYTIKYQLAFPLIDPSNTTSIIAYYRYNYGTGWSSWASIRNSEESTMITVNSADNLVYAINTAYTAGNTTIIVNGGTHDMLSEYGIENSDTSFSNDFDFYGPKIGNNCKIIGINGAKLTANYSGSVDNVKTKFSILNVISNCEIIGLDMEVTNVRYCVHDDPNNLYHSNLSGYRVVYKDCIMKHNGSNGSYSAPACIGAGTTQASEHVIERCKFTSPSIYQNAVTYHNNSGNKTGKVTITNCAFLNDCTIRLYAMEETGSYINALVCGNYIGANINIVPSNADRFDLVAFNNTVY